MPNPRIHIEVCVGSVTDALAAAEAGADRLELCSALCLGGLTPSHGLLAAVIERVEIPVLAMIRPRESGFYYDDEEFATMCRDAQAARGLGADGIVFGVLRADGTVDEARCRTLKELAGDRQTVFHRAFDLVPDPHRALEQLITLGITRVLTSGQQATAVEGVELIRRLREQAACRMEILPGGGLDGHNVAEFLQRTGCDQVHLGLATYRADPTLALGSPIRLVSPQQTAQWLYRTLQPERLRSLVRQLGGPSASNLAHTT